MKLYEYSKVNRQMSFMCPGCNRSHTVTTAKEVSTDSPWDWNGSMESPTFKPSILVTGSEELTDEEYKKVMSGAKIAQRPYRCHSYVTDGKIQFLSDCSHPLAGKTVDLPEVSSTGQIL